MEEKIKYLIQFYKEMELRCREIPEIPLVIAKANTYKLVIEDLEKLLEGDTND